MSSEPHAETAASAYLIAECVQHPLRRAIVTCCGRVLGLSSRELGARFQGKGRRQQEGFGRVLEQALIVAGETNVATLLPWTLAHEGRGTPLGRRVSLLLPALRVLGSSAPVLVFDPGPNDWAACGETAVTLAEAAPGLVVALIASPAVWAQWADGDDTHTHAVLREGVVDLTVPELSERTASVGERTGGGDAGCAGMADDHARSLPERVLFEALEMTNDLRGCFRLNQPVTSTTSGDDLEVDLLCAELEIAVEVDGYFHFQDADAYRRDRRKDIRLQQGGLIVVRVLADDVMARTEDVVASIRMIADNKRARGPDGRHR
jgi:very-short-patch-repair endonuclease